MGSNVDPCKGCTNSNIPPVCNNHIPDSVTLSVNGVNYPSKCVTSNDNLVCTFKDYCN